MGLSTGLKRRPRGEGTWAPVRRNGQIVKGRYRLRVYVGNDPITGKPRQASRTVKASSDAAARRELRRFVTEAEEGKVARVGTEATVAHLLSAWLDTITTTGKAATTIETYRMIIRRHLLPALGKRQLRKLAPHDLDIYYRERLEDGMAPRTVRLHHSILSGALTQAVKWQWIPMNPAQYATPPTLPRGQKFIPEVEQVRRLLVAAKDNPVLETAVALAALTGARRGELCGLRWGDVDWDAGTLLIERQRVRVTGDVPTVGLKHGDRRTVALGPFGVGVLTRWRDHVATMMARLGAEPDWQDGWLLSEDGEPLDPRWLSENVTNLGRRAKVPVTTHAFRRFAATQMVGSGVDVRTAAGRLGHTPEMMLRVYAGFLPSRDEAAADMLGRALEPPTPAL